MEPVQPLSANPVVDEMVTQTEPEQLSAGDNPVLRGGESGDGEVRGAFS
jgi:hypothetical protein